MGGGIGGNFGNTKGKKYEYKFIISHLPKNPKRLLKNGWINTTPKEMSKKTSSQLFTNK